MRFGGLALLLLVVAACGTSSSVVSDGARGNGGSAGMPLGRAWTEGRFEGAETGTAGVPVVNGGVVECETAPVRLTRPGCPLEVPWASDCENEGIHCLYPGESDGCFVEWQCLLGLWSPFHEPCRADIGADPENDPVCSPVLPVDGEPCSFADIECWYGGCADFGYVQASMTCVCGRAVEGGYGCPTVP